MKKQIVKRCVGGVTLATLGLAACTSAAPGQKETAQHRAALEPAVMADLFGFEDPALWSSSTATLSQSTIAVQGEFSMAISGGGFHFIDSPPLTSFALLDDKLKLSVRLPSAQANPWWFGDVQAYVNAPSANLNSQYIGYFGLTGLPTGVFAPVQLTLPPNVVAGLAGGFDDLVIRLVLNVPSDAPAPTLFDDLVFGGVSAGSAGGACASYLDCQHGLSCVAGICTNCAGGGCEGSSCSSAGDCASGLACAAGECASSCISTADCPAFQFCSPSQTCVAASSCTVDGVCSVDVSSPAGSAPFQVALLASKRLVVGDGATVTGPRGALPPILASAGSNPVEVGSRAMIGTLTSAGPVVLGSDALAQGYVVTSSSAARFTGASIIGELQQNTVPSFDAVRWHVRFNAGSSDVVVSASANLQPGAYRNVRVQPGATLFLASGRYDFQSLIIEPGATLRGGALQTQVNVRSRLRLDGSVASSAGPHAVSLLLSYFGREPLYVAAPFAGALAAPAAPVYLRASTAGGFVKGSTLAPEIFVLPGAKVAFVPVAPRGTPGTTGVGIVGGDPNPESSQASPVDVFADNPFFAGSFPAREGFSGEKQGEYSHNYLWHGVADTQFDVFSFAHTTSTPPLHHGFGGLPSDGTGFAVEAHGFEIPEPSGWHFRGAAFLPGNVYAFGAYSQSAVDLEKAEATPLWSRLSRDITVVPVVNVIWRNPNETGESASRVNEEMKAVLDFLPIDFSSRTFSDYQSDDGVDPTQLFGQAQEPPDDIWAQCGIQFRLISTFVLPRDAVAPITCGNQSRAYSSDVQAAIAAVRPDLAALWFAQDGLNPFIVEVGSVPVCPWSGNAIPNARIVQLNRGTWTSGDGVTVAHEFGHLLLGAGHTGLPGSGNLMATAAGPTDRRLTDGQCSTARAAIKGYRRLFHEYSIARGDSGTQLEPVDEDAPWLRVPVTAPPSSECCLIDGEASLVPKVLCDQLGQSTSIDQCRLCCAVNDPAFRDPGGSFDIALSDECSEDRTLLRPQCDLVCCVRDEVGRQQSRYQCAAHNPAAGFLAGEVVTGEDAQEFCPTVVE
jgi:hypothetical protein